MLSFVSSVLQKTVFDDQSLLKFAPYIVTSICTHHQPFRKQHQAAAVLRRGICEVSE